MTKSSSRAAVCSGIAWGRGSTSDGACSTGVKTWFPGHQPDTKRCLGERMASAHCSWCSRYDRHRTLANHSNCRVVNFGRRERGFHDERRGWDSRWNWLQDHARRLWSDCVSARVSCHYTTIPDGPCHDRCRIVHMVSRENCCTIVALRLEPFPKAKCPSQVTDSWQADQELQSCASGELHGHVKQRRQARV